MEKIEANDLNLQCSMGLVCTGKMCDLIALRDVLRNSEGVKIVFNTLSSEHLYILKKNMLSPQQQEQFKSKEK